MRAVYLDRAAEAYAKVITRYPMAPHVEDARDRLVAMNRPVPEPTQDAVAESDAEERSRQPLHFTDKTLGTDQARAHGGGSRACGRTQPGRPQADTGAGYHQAEHRVVQ